MFTLPVGQCENATPVYANRLTEHHAAKTETIQGFNIRRWSDRGLNDRAVSDLAADELAEFGEKFEAAIKGSGTG
jgi:hypothetical protein